MDSFVILKPVTDTNSRLWLAGEHVPFDVFQPGKTTQAQASARIETLINEGFIRPVADGEAPTTGAPYNANAAIQPMRPNPEKVKKADAEVATENV